MKDTRATFAAKMLFHWTERLRDATLSETWPRQREKRICECKAKIKHYSAQIDAEIQELGHKHSWKTIGEDTGGYCNWCELCGAIQDSGGEIRFPVSHKRSKQLIEGADTYTRGVK